MHATLRATSVLAFILCFTGSAAAQYIYMDSNGNGVHDAGDRMMKKGPTTVDFYLNSNHNRDGSLATCNNASPPNFTTLHVSSFGLALKAVGGTVSWGALTETPENFNLLFSLLSNETEHHVFYAAGFEVPWLEPGLHRLGRMQVTAQSGQPALQLVPSHQVGIHVETTHFGTPCPGIDFDNTYKLGSDFQDSDGIAAAGRAGRPQAAASRILFQTAKGGAVRVDLYDIHGRKVRTVFDGALPAGRHDLGVDRVRGGSHLAPGMYFYRISSPEGEFSGRVALSR